MKVRRRRKAPACRSVSSNESSDDEHTPEKQTCRDTPLRSSERLSAKSRRTFHMPDRKAVMDAIPSLSTTPKSVEKLKPRKLVNNYTRVTHRYNYDPASSDDSELDDFIDDYLSYTDDDDDDDGSVKSKKKVNKIMKDDSVKLKQRHHTSVLESDSDSENSECQKIKHNSIIVSNSEGDDDNGSSRPEAISPGRNEVSSLEGNSSQKIKSSEKRESEKSGTSDSELIMLKSHVKKSKKNKRKSLVLASDSESCSGSDEMEHSKKRAVLLDDSDSDSQELERLYSSNEEGEKLPSERAQLMAARREARRRLFEQLKTKKRK